jgi:hypothetical protein
MPFHTGPLTILLVIFSFTFNSRWKGSEGRACLPPDASTGLVQLGPTYPGHAAPRPTWQCHLTRPRRPTSPRRELSLPPQPQADPPDNDVHRRRLRRCAVCSLPRAPHKKCSATRATAPRQRSCGRIRAVAIPRSATPPPRRRLSCQASFR